LAQEKQAELPAEELQADPRKETKTDIIELEIDNADKKENTKQILHDIRFYALPLLSLIFFIALLLGPIIGNITDIFAKIDQINTLRETDTQLADRIDRLTALQASSTQDQSIIDKINELVPTAKTEVLKFRQRVADNATQSGLTLQGSTSTEDVVSGPSSTQANTSTLSLLEIPSKFNLSGSFQDFKAFLAALSTEGQDFFVVQEMNLSLSTDEAGVESWGATINLVKYQFYVSTAFNPVTVYGSVSEDTTPDPIVVNFIKARFLTGSNSLPTNTTTTPSVTPTGQANTIVLPTLSVSISPTPSVSITTTP
jgi:Tfp pilus assembly protein PilN